MNEKEIRNHRIALVVFLTPAIVLIPLAIWGISPSSAVTIVIFEIILITYSFKYFNPKPKDKKKQKSDWTNGIGAAGEIGLLIFLLVLGLIALFYLAIGIQLAVFWILQRYGRIDIDGLWKRVVRILVFFGLLGLITWVVWKRPDSIAVLLRAFVKI